MAKEYHSKDFEWEELRNEIENDPSLSYHLQQSTVIDSESECEASQSQQQQQDSDSDSDSDSVAWNNFHTTHSTAKFYKERRYLFKEFPDLASFSLFLEVGCGNGSTALPILRYLSFPFLNSCFLYLIASLHINMFVIVPSKLLWYMPVIAAFRHLTALNTMYYVLLLMLIPSILAFILFTAISLPMHFLTGWPVIIANKLHLNANTVFQVLVTNLSLYTCGIFIMPTFNFFNSCLARCLLQSTKRFKCLFQGW